MDLLLHDLRGAFRSLARRPGFSLLAVSILTLGIGANSLIFSLVRGTLLRSLDYPHAGRLAMIWADFGDDGQSLPAVNGQDFRDYQRLAVLFEDFAAAAGPQSVGLSGVVRGADGQPGIVDLAPVTSNFFPVLGVDPFLGRHFRPEDEELEAPRTAIISHRYWQSRFGGEVDVLDRALEIDGLPHAIVGVLPRGFRLHLPAEAFRLHHSDVWVALQWDYENQTRPRNFTTFSVFGLLKPGVSFDQAQTEMSRMATVLREAHPEHEAGDLRLRAVPLHEDVVKGARPALLALQAAVAFVLLIVCSNLANLMLVWNAGRRRDLTIHAALGASRRQIVRRALLECLLLAGIGAGLGLLAANLGLDLLKRWELAHLPRFEDVRIDSAVVLFTVGLTLLTVLLFGLLPASRGSRVQLASVLRSAGRSSPTAREGRLRRALVLGEMALSLVLLVGMGLMVRSLASLAGVHPGFEAEGRLAFQARLPAASYPNRETQTVFFRELERRVLALPGVVGFGAGSQLPLTGSGPLQPYAWNEETARNWESVTADGRWVTPGYFETMGTRLLEGRDFRWDDLEGPPRIIVDESLARRVWPGRSPVGERLQVRPTGSEEPMAEVLGVVEHVRMHELGRELQSQIYRPTGWFRNASYVVQVEPGLDLHQLARRIEQEVRAIDPGLPVGAVRSLTEILRDSTSQARLNLILSGVFGGVALVLAALGIYGVMSLSVGQRTRELAIRLALGETKGSIQRRVLWQGLILILPASVLGLMVSTLLGRFTERILFGVEPTDAVTLGTAVGVLVVVGLLACWIPAWRATRLELATVLRGE